MQNNTTIALMYDFDNTLSTRDMQEYDFIPQLNMTAEEFWAEANGFAKANNTDGILAVMLLMKQKALGTELCTRDKLVESGKKIEFHKGVLTWFDRINAFAASNGVNLEHYIISSGLKPMIEGSAIGKYFKQIYACDFVYDKSGQPIWPAVAVNYTSKVQFLYRINKGVFDVSENVRLNSFMAEEERHVPFCNMIYIGDGLTDVPCMKLTRQNGGQSIGVYKEGTKNQYLIKEDRVNFLVKADYSQNSELELIVQTIILKVRAECQLERITHNQSKAVLKQMKSK